MTISNQLTTLINCFTKPIAANQKLRNHQARLLSWILLVATVFSVATLFIILVFNPHRDPRFHQYIILISGLSIFSIFLQVLNCAGFYYASATLLVIGTALSPWVSLLIDPSILQGDFVPLIYVTISTLLSSIFLPIHITITLTFLQFTGISLVFLFSPASASFNWISLLAYVFLISVLSILKNSIIQHDMKQITDQASQLVIQKAILREQATHDDLTGLFNRRYFVETLKYEVQRGTSEKNAFGIVLMDVDHFKRINDTCGHSIGDVVIQGVGNFLANHVRGSDVACRYGGDEFILILPNTTQETTRERAEQLRNGMKNLSLPVGITISLGIAIFPENGTDGETLLRSADAALYRAKQNGGDCVFTAK